MLCKPVTTYPYARVIAGVVLLFSIIFSAGIVTLINTKNAVYKEQSSTPPAPAPFPIGVDPAAKTITENNDVLPYLQDYLAADTVKPVRISWIHNLTRKLATLSWYQNLASPITRILVIWPGDRKEQVVDNFGDILHWNTEQRHTFSQLVTEHDPALPDGTFFPGRYVTDKDATPDTVATLITSRFDNEVKIRYPNTVAEKVSLPEALTIASLLEREAYSFDHMRIISGVIWNRMFAGMPLQLDATLQYAKGSESSSARWWPVVRPDDKYIDSPYNTYENKGLPPAPIANPSAEALLAALNPVKTDCLYYFHDSSGTIHCSKTYKEHVKKLNDIYGRGK